MRVWWLWWMLGAALVPAQAEDGAHGEAVNTVAVLMKFDRAYPAATLESMKREAEEVLRGCGLRIQWRIIDDSTSQETFENLVVARFHGQCGGEAAPSAPRTRALAFTHVAGDEVQPFPEVDCDRLRTYVAPRLARLSRSWVDRMLGLALGRIMAHEMYHILAKTKAHGKAGLAKAVLTPGDLLGTRPRLGAEEAESIRKRLRRPSAGTAETALR